MNSSIRQALCIFILLFSAGINVWAQTLTPIRAELYHDGWTDFNKNGKKDIYEDASQPIDKRIDDLLAQMNVDEKTCQLATAYGFGRFMKDPLPTPGWKNEIWKDGIANIDEMHNGIGKGNAQDPLAWPPSTHARAINEIQRWFIEETRLGVPVDFTNEGIRGMNSLRTTNFPAQVGLGATWDRDLISQIGQITGREGRAWGYTNIYSPILDLSRDPRWGRVADCYSEDPYLVAELGVRQAIALQAQGVASTPKHFAIYSEPKGGRDGADRTDPHVSPREVEMLHLYPWARVVREAGVLGAMSSYNDYDGVPISGGHEFLIDRLRTQWGFKGYIVSDSGAVEFLSNKHRVAPTLEDGAAMFIAEGGNVRTQFDSPGNFLLPLRQAIADGRLPVAAVDARVRDVLRVKFLLGLFDRPYVDPEKADAINHTPASAAVALRAARESIVLLKNQNNTLPLSRGLKRILVCGPTAQITETILDRYGSTGGTVVTLLEGLKAAAGPGTEVVFSQGCNAFDARWPESEIDPQPPEGADAQMIADAVAKAADADAIVLGLGDASRTIGEGKSRTSLDLPGFQTDLAKAMVKTGKPVIVVLLTGRAASINWIDRNVPAVLEAWFPGELGGQAVAEAIFGDFSPGGKLPVTFPRSAGQLPFNFPYKPSSQVRQVGGNAPSSMVEGALYPFGYGLSYTTFACSDLAISPAAIKAVDTVSISTTVKNTGTRPGDAVVQLYLEQAFSSVTTYDMNLRGFERVALQPGESKTLTFKVPAQAMEIINREGKRVVEPGKFNVMIGQSSADIQLRGSYQVSE